MTQELLMIEDDTRLATMVGEYLRQSGYGFTHAADGISGLAALQSSPPDLVILDLMLPDMDGLEVCRRIKGQASGAAHTAVLMLTAKGDPMDRIVGLEIGADDYLPKPFEPRELLARIRAVLRRGVEVGGSGSNLSANGHKVMRFGSLEIDRDARTVKMRLGSLGSCSMALRIRPMCTSMERSNASSSRPRTASMIWSRLSTRPARSASATSKSNW